MTKRERNERPCLRELGQCLGIFVVVLALALVLWMVGEWWAGLLVSVCGAPFLAVSLITLVRCLDDLVTGKR